jgi:hypothetical protein
VASAIVSMVRAFARLTESADDEIALEAAKHIRELRDDVFFNASYSVLDDDFDITWDDDLRDSDALNDYAVDEGDAPYVPCECPVCVEGDDLPGDDNLSLIFTYGVFAQ